MKKIFSRFLSDYGMIFVLLLLCGFFSVVTISDQSPTGEAAANQVAESITEQFGKTPRVLIAVGEQPGDAEFAASLERSLAASGAQVLATAKGQPPAAREALVKLNTAGEKVDAVACTQVTGAWIVFSDLKTDFPALGEPRVIAPRSYRWPNFLKSENLLNVASQIAIIAIIAIGMTMVIITGGIDLSVGSLVALSSVLTAIFIRDFAGGTNAQPGGMLLACLAAMALCGLIGAFSGGMITRFGIPPFIVTLSMLLVGSGLAYKISNNQSIYDIPDSFKWLGREADLLSLPNAVVLMLFLYALAHVLMSRMKLGRYLYAVGGNQEAARLAGVPVKRVIIFAYIASAMLAGLGGVIMASQFKSGSGTYGNMAEMWVIAAVVVGGTSLTGGHGKIFGTLIGAFIIGVIQNGMNLMNVESQTQKIVVGLVILGAVLLDKLRQSR